MPMQLWKVKNSSAGLGEKVFLSLLHIWQRYFTLTGRCLKNPPVYDDLCPDEELLRDALGQDLEFLSNGHSVSISSLPAKLRVLTIVMFHNLYPLSNTGYMNLGCALFLHDLISDVQIDICAHIFHRSEERRVGKEC